MKLIQDTKVVQLIAPVADVFAGSGRSNTINMQDYHLCTAIVNKGAMVTAGAVTFTAYSSATSAGTTLTAIPFRYKTPTATLDSYNDEALATATGYAMTPNRDNTCDIIEINESDMSGTDKYLTLIGTETVNGAITAGVVGILSGARQQGDDKRTARV